MIRDDATPEELDRWFRRTPEEIAQERASRWDAGWSALRLPEHLAREPDLAGGEGVTGLAGGAGADPIAKRAAMDAYQRALLDTIASSESPGYDVLYSPTREVRRMKRGANGQPDYSRHPNDPAQITSGPNKGKWSSAAGRYQFINGTWSQLAKDHPDLTDFSPENQDWGAWYLASDRYKRETGRDLAADIRDPDQYGRITGALRKEWTSLPGGIEQGQGGAQFRTRMEEGLARHQPRPAQK